ncbi:hypothetical protein R1sor_008848 [Riccia sorocarpa]|uniref:Protein kinase domain-containing protein n=1 Tax=Riccia sorocarpa TaxID=122646 RepID=A0ABD3H816_9MARC
MASRSRQDKGKAPMIPEDDIGTEEGELLDQDPPRCKAVVRSDSNMKRKHTAVKEDPLALALRPGAYVDNRYEAQRKKAIKDERYPTMNSKNEAEQDKWRKIAEIWMRWFEEKKYIKEFECTSGKYKLCELLSDNTIRWTSPQGTFTRMDETTRLGSGQMGLTHRVGIVDEELAEVLGHHEVVHYVVKVMHRQPGDKKVHEKCICKMMAFPESHHAIIRPIGLSKDKKKPMLLLPIWNGGTIEKYMELEKRSIGRTSLEGIRVIDHDWRDHVTADEWLNIQIFRKHTLQIAGTMVDGLVFMHLHKWLHANIHKQNVLLHFPSWDWNETKVRADSGKDKENRLLKPAIIHFLVFVGIGDLGKAQSFDEVARLFDPYLVSDTSFRPWIAPELNKHKAKNDEA